eukprot:750213-Hanusia_phi.AAC.1
MKRITGSFRGFRDRRRPGSPEPGARIRPRPGTQCLSELPKFRVNFGLEPLGPFSSTPEDLLYYQVRG